MSSPVATAVVDHAQAPEFASVLVAGTTHEACLVNPVTGELKPLTIQLMSPIATGGQGSVWKGQVIETKKVVAVKASENQESLLEEAATCELFVDDPNMVTVLGYASLPSPTKSKIQAPVFEFCENGTLGDMIGRHEQAYHSVRLQMDTPMINKYQLFIVMHDLVHALEHIHQKNLAHCDVKPCNSMLVCDPVGSGPLEDIDFFGIKVIDFGLSLPMNYDYAVTGGTQVYMGPEHYMPRWDPDHVHQPDPAPVQPNTDTWAVGVTGVEALCGCDITRGFPAGESLVSLHRRKAFLTDVVMPMLKQIPDLHEKWITFFTMCFEYSTFKRVSPRELARHLDTHPAFQAERDMMAAREFQLQNFKFNQSSDDEYTASEDEDEEVAAPPRRLSICMAKGDAQISAPVPDSHPAEDESDPMSPGTPEVPCCRSSVFTDAQSVTAASCSTSPAVAAPSGSDCGLDTAAWVPSAEACAPACDAGQAQGQWVPVESPQVMECAKGSPKKRSGKLASWKKRAKAWFARFNCFKKPTVVQ